MSIHWNEEILRTYRIGRNVFPSVTTICAEDSMGGGSLHNWKMRTRNWKEISRYKAVTGTIVHFVAANHTSSAWNYPHVPLDLDPADAPLVQESYDKGGINLPGYRDGMLIAVKKGLMAFGTWFDEYEPEPAVHEAGALRGRSIPVITPEHVVHHDRLLYAGTVDLPCSINGENWIIDLKFNDRMYHKYNLQMMGYRLCVRRMYPTTKFEHMAILNLGTANMTARMNVVEPTAVLEKDWLRVLGAYYYNRRYNPELSANATRVVEYLTGTGVEIIPEVATNPNWRNFGRHGGVQL